MQDAGSAAQAAAAFAATQAASQIAVGAHQLFNAVHPPVVVPHNAGLVAHVVPVAPPVVPHQLFNAVHPPVPVPTFPVATCAATQAASQVAVTPPDTGIAHQLFKAVHPPVPGPAVAAAVCAATRAARQTASHVTAAPLVIATVPQKLFKAVHPPALAAAAAVPVPHQLFKAVHPAASETLVSTKVTTVAIWLLVATSKVEAVWGDAVKVGISDIEIPPNFGAV